MARIGILLTVVFSVIVLCCGTIQAQWYNDCCENRVGDANGVGGDEPTIGDVSVMIDVKFIAPWRCESVIPCLAEADVNQSGGIHSGCGDITIGDVSILIDYIFITGSKLGLNDCSPVPAATGSFLEIGPCKTEPGVALADPTAYDQTCIEYEYDGYRELTIRHVNAAFNCCPSYITPEFMVEDWTITVIEGEDLTYGVCDCLCLFDVDYVIDLVRTGQYQVVINELYTQPGDVPLDFTIDLTTEPSSGTVCVERTHYPWGQ